MCVNQTKNIYHWKERELKALLVYLLHSVLYTSGFPPHQFCDYWLV